jgi:hypothetical protein
MFLGTLPLNHHVIQRLHRDRGYRVQQKAH